MDMDRATDDEPADVAYRARGTSARYATLNGG